MIVTLSHWIDAAGRHRVWLASLGAAAAINFALFWLASIAPMGRLAKVETDARIAPVEIVMRRRVPPPPDLPALGTPEPAIALPPRFRPKILAVQALPDLQNSLVLPPPRLRLNLNPCDPADDEAMRRLDCAPPRDWARADRDAAELLGPETQGMTLDEVAAARGWIKPKARSGQDAMAATTDTTLPEQIFKDAPFPPHAIERTGGW